MDIILVRTAFAVAAATLASVLVGAAASASGLGPVPAATAGAAPEKLVGRWVRNVTELGALGFPD